MGDADRHRGSRSGARRLVELALQGGGPDNITCIVADVAETATTHMPTTRTPVVTGAAPRNQKARATETPAQHFSGLADPKPDSSPVTISATSLGRPHHPIRMTSHVGQSK